MISDFILDMKKNGVSLFIVGDELRYRAAAGAMTSEMKAAAAARKFEIVTFLRFTHEQYNAVLKLRNAPNRRRWSATTLVAEKEALAYLENLLLLR